MSGLLGQHLGQCVGRASNSTQESTPILNQKQHTPCILLRLGSNGRKHSRGGNYRNLVSPDFFSEVCSSLSRPFDITAFRRKPKSASPTMQIRVSLLFSISNHWQQRMRDNQGGGDAKPLDQGQDNAFRSSKASMALFT